jgi:hypothetical protein
LTMSVPIGLFNFFRLSNGQAFYPIHVTCIGSLSPDRRRRAFAPRRWDVQLGSGRFRRYGDCGLNAPAE